jgi:hypothetical protein
VSKLKRADVSWAYSDAGAVTVEIISPSNVVTSFTWPGDDEVVREKEGVFYFDLTVDAAGVWKYRWSTVGNVIAATRGQFVVRA